MKLHSKFWAIALIVFLTSILEAHAAAPRGQCQFDAQLKELTAIKNKTDLAQEQRLGAELELRKTIIGKVADCATKETNTFKETVSAVSSQGDLEIQEVILQFNEDLDDAILYYENQKAKLNGIELDNTKKLAREISGWRSSHYLPIIENISNFLIWNKNQELLKTTERRLAAVEKSVKDSSREEKEEAEILLALAKTNLLYAQSSHQRARRIFIEPFAPKDAPFLIKGTLESLAQTYNIFLKINKIITAVSP